MLQKETVGKGARRRRASSPAKSTKAQPMPAAKKKEEPASPDGEDDDNETGEAGEAEESGEQKIQLQFGEESLCPL